MLKGNILPSERDFAFKLKLEAIKGQGARTDLSRVDEIVAEQVVSSRNQVQRYIRLTELIPEIFSMVDEKKIAINPDVELSYLKKRNRPTCLRPWIWNRLFPHFHRHSY